MILLVTPEVIANNPKEAYQVLGEPELAGHITTSGPHTRFTMFRVPYENRLCPPGEGAPIVETAFTILAKSDTRGGSKHIIQHQSVADKLIDCKMRIETSRLLVWKAVCKLDDPAVDWKVKLEISMQAKIYSTDCAVDCVVDAMKAVGMKSYAKDMSFPRLLNEAMYYPLFDGGNIGLRRRQIQRLMTEEENKPWEATYSSRGVEKGRL
ncbi:hypothetical protein NW755_006209 [Fusarium falciforme]|uniref:Acyl-CoA dehydrogenase/oxidase C-terminal domain-containing protein n=1 Tax=Fusarium falciforme TaxID=195108 RepID=A0A9W8R9R9_9HYPO|nr:hypothetical protein NW755_006209 [Fusarium falciforme]